MTIFYRITPKESQHEEARPVLAHNKFKLVEFCLKSFLKVFKGEKIVFLLDGCDKKWEKMILKNVKPQEVIHYDNIGQNESYLEQLELASNLDDDEIVFFQEDDYYYLPNKNIKNILIEAIKQLGYVNPYDHMEFYTVPEYHSPLNNEIHLIANHHFRSCGHNTMTWGTTSANIKKHKAELKWTGFWDKATWDLMKQVGVTLYSPIPSFCTHMHKNYLSPGINWRFNVDK